MPRKTQIQIRRDTSSNWTSVNPTLSAGELGLESDTGRLKVGDGSTKWTSLTYSQDASKISGTTINSTVKSSSLTSVGTLSSLSVSGALTFSGLSNGVLSSTSGTVSSGNVSTTYGGLPTAGANNAILAKTSTSNYATAWTSSPTLTGATLTGLSTAGIVTNTAGGVLGTTLSPSLTGATLTGLNVAGIVTNTAAGVLGTVADVPLANGGTGGEYGSGWMPIKPTSVTGSGTRTINADGSVTLTSSSTPIFNGVFTSAYRNYKVLFSSNSTGGASMTNVCQLRMAAGGTPDSTANYAYSNFYSRGSGTTIATGTTATQTTAQTSALLAYALDFELTFFGPQLARTTQIYFYTTYAITTHIGNAYYGSPTQFDGFQLLNNSYSGVVRIYGLL